MCFGLSETTVQKLVDFMEYYFQQVQILAFDVAEAKVNVRNLLVFFNSLALKLAISNPHLPTSQNPQDSDNAKSHLAKMNPDTKKLLEWL